VKLCEDPLIRVGFVVLLMGVVSQAFSQNLESVGKERPFSLTGGVSANQIFYAASGIDDRRDPYSYFLAGNLNLSLYGWSVPVSFSYSNQNVSFQQPFNQYSVHPTYKWITGHFGYNSMSFSPYTVSGHIFLGGGVDVAPEGKWKFSALYGRFLKAVENDTSRENSIPAYKRMGYGFKASYSDEDLFADLIVFHAEDDANSIASLPDSLDILPQENLVMSLAAGKTFFNHFVLRGEFATSALSRDIRADETGATHPLGKAGFLYKPRLSSSYYNAFKVGFDFQKDNYTIGVGYERIDPQYRTLGAYYFNSDLQNITVNAATTILQDKMNIAVSAGRQRDNLDNSKVSTMQRTVGSLSVNYTPSERLNFSVNYSTFQSFTNIRSQFVDINQLTPFDNLDTLNFTQLSSNATLSGAYNFGRNEQRKQNVSLNFTYQDAADKQDGITVDNSGMQFYNLNTGYSMSMVPQSMTVSVSVNATLNDGAIASKTIGPTAAVNKAFFQKKLRATFSTAYNNTYMQGERVNTILNFRLNGSMNVQKKHNINLSVAVVNRNSLTQENSKSFTEYTGTLGYSYSFALK
jgi:hypothetical protein